MELVHCTCGGYGSVTRECALHPDEYAKHVAELKFEHDSYAGELLAEALREPNPVAVLRQQLAVARRRVEDASSDQAAYEEALEEAERLRGEAS